MQFGGFVCVRGKGAGGFSAAGNVVMAGVLTLGESTRHAGDLLPWLPDGLFAFCVLVCLGFSSWDVRHGDGPGRAGPRLRSGAFAPDSPRRPPPRRHLRCRLRRLPSDSLGLIDAPRTPGRHRTGLEQLKSSGRRDGQCAWRSVGDWPGVEASCGARPRSAARAASGDLRGVLRRGDDASRVARFGSEFFGGGDRAGCLTPNETLRQTGIHFHGCQTPNIAVMNRRYSPPSRVVRA